MEIIKSGIITSEEKIFWQGKVAKSGINSRKIRNILYIILGVLVIILMMISMMTNPEDIQRNGNILFFVFINVIVSLLMMIVFWRGLITSELIHVEYYITDKKVFDRNKEKENNDDYYQYQVLNFEAINKIIIHPSKIFRRKVAHIDFYSKSIRENRGNLFFRIKNDDSHREPTEFWRTPMHYERFRFYSVEDYETVKSVLLKLVPEKIQIS